MCFVNMPVTSLLNSVPQRRTFTKVINGESFQVAEVPDDPLHCPMKKLQLPTSYLLASSTPSVAGPRKKPASRAASDAVLRRLLRLDRQLRAADLPRRGRGNLQ